MLDERNLTLAPVLLRKWLVRYSPPSPWSCCGAGMVVVVWGTGVRELLNLQDADVVVLSCHVLASFIFHLICSYLVFHSHLLSFYLLSSP